ncbi:MAG: hypothetical protein ACQCN3_04700 [Candidatus Bathyarchaeia archaeon]|jgi:hypothetical protein
MRKIVILPLMLAFALLVSVSATAFAAYSYNVQVTSPVGQIMPGDTVTLVAISDDPAPVSKVTFQWFEPTVYDPSTGVASGPAAYTETDTTPGDGFTSSNVVNTAGEWYVLATFYPITDTDPAPPVEVTKLTVVIFNVVPELPLLGTAGAAVAMVGGLVYFKKRNLTVA